VWCDVIGFMVIRIIVYISDGHFFLSILLLKLVFNPGSVILCVLLEPIRILRKLWKMVDNKYMCSLWMLTLILFVCIYAGNGFVYMLTKGKQRKK
jgi:hypothetical protein